MRITERLIEKGSCLRVDARVPGGLYSLDKVKPDQLGGIAAAVHHRTSPTCQPRFVSHAAVPHTLMAGLGALATIAPNGRT